MDEKLLQFWNNFSIMVSIIEDLNDLCYLTDEERDGYLEFYIDNYMEKFIGEFLA